MKRLSISWHLLTHGRLLDFATTLNSLVKQTDPARLGFQLQFDHYLPKYEKFTIGINKVADAIRISRKEMDDNRDNRLKAFMSHMRTASLCDNKDFNKIGFGVIRLYKSINQQMTEGSYARQTSNMITFLAKLEEHFGKYLPLIPWTDTLLADLIRDHEAFIAATREKTEYEEVQKSILSATEYRREFIASIELLFNKLEMLETEARLMDQSKLLDALSLLIRQIETLIENTERDVAAANSAVEEDGEAYHIELEETEIPTTTEEADEEEG